MIDSKKKRILAIGGIYVDINCYHYPHDGSLQAEVEYHGDEYDVIAGGSGVNFARLCVALGLDATFVGKVGADAMGRLAAELLEDAGVTPALTVDSTGKTNFNTSFVNADGLTVMPGAGNANQLLGPEDILHKVLPLLPEIDFLYLGSCLKLQKLLPAYPELVRQAKAAGCTIVIDHGRVPPQGVSDAVARAVQELVLSSDVYVPSRDEFLQLWQADSLEKGLRTISQQGSVQTIVKDGANGAFTLIDDTVRQVIALPTEVHNTVGAGDAFNAGVMYAQAGDKDLLESIRYGCAVASLRIANKPVSPTTVDELLSA